ncbi:glycosyl transferase [Spectribacter hydrogenoxidans]|uniref:Glycosyl transferase n=1 Tax=Spectribacter hydrogenoxidans TaxID=3075608 RepID=A0ABU3BWE9_9GAMM|nr:glycosyl transferase [Salinisphaera sp. W335]MDT0633604.1 glycosyl transferase [Salinisphaera sp. W335]
MADFHQNGIITTLHRLGDRSLESLENELVTFGRRRPMTLVLPCLYSELEGTALPRIVEALRQVPYLAEIVIGLDAADEQQFAHAREFFACLPQRHRILWNDGPRMQEILQQLTDEDLAPARPGKGANVWLCLGYFLASDRGRALALHDCDIESYTRDLPARLFYPIVHPNFVFKFAKGYYARVADGRMHGRVARLFVTPMLRALMGVAGPLDFLSFMDSFRYPLAGEFAMSAGVAETIRIPADWGLEVGILAEVHRHYTANAVCQVDIAETYEHKHQELSAEDASKGLARMSSDIAKALYRKLATHGVVLTPETIRTVKAMYLRNALDFVERFYFDAQINGLTLDRHAEEKTVEVFVESIINAGDQFLANPMEVPFIPTWNRVRAAIPGLPAAMYEAVEADNA